MIRGLVYASYSLPEWQAVKLTFFAPWSVIIYLSNWHLAIEKTLENNQIIYTVQKTFIVIVIVVVIVVIIIIISSIIILCLGFDGKDVGNG